MSGESSRELFQAKIDELSQMLGRIRRNMESLAAENHRLKEVVRLAEAELRNRRDQVQRLEKELQTYSHRRLEVRARVEHAIEKIDGLLAAESKT
jgi:chromosome segregation ATPase